ncbi:TraR/DksA C4-type zinc finger protein [Candidatus Daviesbacteria bacterium]|nr:TraR/DksA C4-type zinc finger protein [Candidatus Daviesbacteria bacterium]
MSRLNRRNLSSNNPISLLGKFKNLLIRRKKEIESDIKSLEKDDPVMDATAPVESSEPGTDSWLADTHSRIVAAKNNLQEMLTKITRALLRMKSGHYGKCENCGRTIEASRLEAMPTATLCISCSKKRK